MSIISVLNVYMERVEFRSLTNLSPLIKLLAQDFDTLKNKLSENFAIRSLHSHSN